MFARIMAVVMAAILVTAICLSGIWWITLRNQQVDARLDYLISEGEDIAYLAAKMNGSGIGSLWGDPVQDSLNAKASMPVMISFVKSGSPLSDRSQTSLSPNSFMA